MRVSFVLDEGTISAYVSRMEDGRGWITLELENPATSFSVSLPGFDVDCEATALAIAAALRDAAAKLHAGIEARYQEHRADDPHCTCNDCVDTAFAAPREATKVDPIVQPLAEAVVDDVFTFRSPDQRTKAIRRLGEAIQQAVEQECDDMSRELREAEDRPDPHAP